MTRLDDELIARLANAKAPHAYSHEVKYMAQEILERREAEAAASKGNLSLAQPQSKGGMWP